MRGIKSKAFQQKMQTIRDLNVEYIYKSHLIRRTHDTGTIIPELIIQLLIFFLYFE